ncbi:sigma-70 family RNA polymerase sigma factor [Paenibacillus sp. GSMTC-2017]|uniref:sigma-70 family RNA polymerase sigma factor n=1 Tax=Paenibacillus sp. GSMTC-2017 TaxID=2794350 RepID=UPI0018D8E404|nr:sigma-70 family RNA polymerase sigma factor [Paenibacillus sp. GSMTC-2017]MBH5320850.1 sigma-70 family RNA polymerase sigma factor [Paenibacillus sp. GSMTC-2017]
MNGMDENELTVSGIRGDDEALLRRIEQEKSKMYGIAFSYMRNESDALEAIQETVCRVWMKRKSLRQERLFTTWMIRILINVCMDERKKRKREKPIPSEQLDLKVTRNESIEKLSMAEEIMKLSPNLRMVIVLKYYRDMTITEIADLLEKPDGTIRTWLHKALKQMRKDMKSGEEVTLHEQMVEEGWGRG